jgi:hypothetical protein
MREVGMDKMFRVFMAFAVVLVAGGAALAQDEGGGGDAGGDVGGDVAGDAGSDIGGDVADAGGGVDVVTDAGAAYFGHEESTARYPEGITEESERMEYSQGTTTSTTVVTGGWVGPGYGSFAEGAVVGSAVGAAAAGFAAGKSKSQDGKGGAPAVTIGGAKRPAVPAKPFTVTKPSLSAADAAAANKPAKDSAAGPEGPQAAPGKIKSNKGFSKGFPKHREASEGKVEGVSAADAGE